MPAFHVTNDTNVTINTVVTIETQVAHGANTRLQFTFRWSPSRGRFLPPRMQFVQFRPQCPVQLVKPGIASGPIYQENGQRKMPDAAASV
jgi:hypothetical protein